MDWEAFLTLHADLPREGPGSPEDVAWAVDLGGMAGARRICDAGCATGGDIAALLTAAPGAEVLGIDMVESFVETARLRFAGEPRVRIEQGDMAALPGPFDMIWCAGALYFLGLDKGPRAMADALRDGGVLAFSEPCFFEVPTEAARAMWGDYPTQDAAGIVTAVEAAGFEVLGTRRVSDAGWEAYYAALDARAAELRSGADAALLAVLDEHAAEAARWRAVKDQTGYLLVVARKGTA